MNYQHKELAAGRWQELSFLEQMANIGSEVERVINWKEKRDDNYSWAAFERALELLDLTIADPKNKTRLRELCRIREVFADYFAADNSYQSTAEQWRRYFDAFGYAAAKK